MTNFIKLGLAVAVLVLGAQSELANASETSRTTLGTTKAYNVEKASDFGLGLQWGALTGINGKYWPNENAAVAFGAAFADGNTAINVDYLYHFRDGIVSNSDLSRRLVPYVGAGLIGAFGSNTNFFYRNTDRFGLAARVPLGIEFLPRQLPLGIYGEVAPSLGLTPSNYTFLSADVGARYYF